MPTMAVRSSAKRCRAEETRARNREQAKRSAEKKKEAHAAALEEADGLRTDNASLRKLRPPSLSLSARHD